VRSLRLGIGFGVDTTSSVARKVLDLYRRYLTEPSDSVRATLWSERERARWRPYDLLASYVYQGFSDFTVVQLRAAVGLPETYCLTALVSAIDDSTRAVRPLALYSVYAIRQDGAWVLANALPRMTRKWPSDTVGAVIFIHPPTYELDHAAARATAAFVDSLAAAFRLPKPQPISYYFTADLSETLRALGLEFFPLGADTVGGRSNVLTRQVFVGSSSNGEGYRHELAHIILGPVVSSLTAPLLIEGLMTWTGGSAGLDYSRLLPGLARYVAGHPGLTLQSVMEHPPPRDGSLDVGYDGLAVLCQLVYLRGGLPALRAILGAGRSADDVLATSARELGVSRTSLDSLWRATILRHQGRGSNDSPPAGPAAP